ncbi:MAG: hypothetical protein IKG39_10730 [Lachnospiraceae bacterium]|nr:hypothetical protein [Lachnospiraceae bacterium]
MNILNDLKNYYSSMQEIELLTNDLKHYKSFYKDLESITGVNQKKISFIIEKLNNQLEKAGNALKRTTEFLDRINDPELRVILILRYAHGLTVKETAEQLGCSQETIYLKSRKIKEVISK